MSISDHLVINGINTTNLTIEVFIGVYLMSGKLYSQKNISEGSDLLITKPDNFFNLHLNIASGI